MMSHRIPVKAVNLQYVDFPPAVLPTGAVSAGPQLCCLWKNQMQKAQVRYLVMLWWSGIMWLCHDLITRVNDSYAEKLNLMPADTRGHSKDTYSPCKCCITAYIPGFTSWVLVQENKNKWLINYNYFFFSNQTDNINLPFSLCSVCQHGFFILNQKTLLFIKLWKVSHCHLVVRLDSCAFLSG